MWSKYAAVARVTKRRGRCLPDKMFLVLTISLVYFVVSAFISIFILFYLFYLFTYLFLVLFIYLFLLILREHRRKKIILAGLSAFPLIVIRTLNVMKTSPPNPPY